jgi:heptosyltransferase-1
LKIPVVAIFGPTNPARNGPFGTQSIVLRSASSVTDHAGAASRNRGCSKSLPPKLSPRPGS